MLCSAFGSGPNNDNNKNVRHSCSVCGSASRNLSVLTHSSRFLLKVDKMDRGWQSVPGAQTIFGEMCGQQFGFDTTRTGQNVSALLNLSFLCSWADQLVTMMIGQVRLAAEDCLIGIQYNDGI